MDTWTPSDFLLFNRFCTSAQIGSELDALARLIQAPWLVLISFDAIDRLESLSFVAGTNPGLATRIASRMRTAQWLSKSAACDQDEHDAKTFVAQLLDSKSAVRLEAIRTSYPSADEAMLGVWLIAPESLESGLSNEMATRFAEMVNGTLIANSSRDGRIADLVSVFSTTEPLDHDETMSALLILALTVSHGEAAQFFEFQPMPGQLVAGTMKGENLSEKLASSQVVSLNDDGDENDLRGVDDTIQRAFRKSRTFIFPPPTGGNDTAGFVAIPVPVAPLANESSLGVIGIWTSATSTLTNYQLGLLRNVALRVALLVTNRDADQSSKELTQFSLNLGQSSAAQARDALDTIVSTASRLVPSDISALREELELLAEHLLQATKCSSVTVRILMPTFSVGHPQLVLRRFVARPSDRMSKSHGDIPIADLNSQAILRPGSRASSRRKGYWRTSANAYAATIDTVHVPDTRARFRGVRELDRVTAVDDVPPRSEMTFPIIADGMVVGTLNLESDYPHTFTYKAAIIETFAALAGVLIGMHRRDVLRAVADRLSLLHRGFHDALQWADIVDELPPALLREAEVAAASKKVTGGKRRAGLVPTEPVDLTTCVRNALAAIEGPPAITIDVAAGSFLSAHVASVVTESLREVFRNIRDNLGKDASVAKREVKLVSGRYWILIVRSRSDLPVDNDRQLRRLYRGPIPDAKGRDRPHLGCFTAGELIRGVGGNIFAGLAEDDALETYIFIPKGES